MSGILKTGIPGSKDRVRFSTKPDTEGFQNPLCSLDGDPVVVVPLVAGNLSARDAESLGEFLLRQVERDSCTHEPTPDVGKTEKRPQITPAHSLVGLNFLLELCGKRKGWLERIRFLIRA